jgi:hypothetical protein
MSRRVSIPASIRKKIKIACRGLCCICHQTGIEIHHIDGDHSNNEWDNLIPLCRNHHDVYSSSRGLSGMLTIEELKEVRDNFYAQVPPRESNAQVINEVRELKLKIDKLMKIREGTQNE